MKTGDLKRVNGVISRLQGYSASQDNPLDIEFKFIELLTDRAIFVNISKLETIENLTQEEINSIKPKFKRGDVVVSDEFYHGCSSKKGHILYRYKGGLGECLHKVESIIIADGEFKFDTDCGTIDKHNKATPAQIKQLELEEMKHGKKWNGDGYDDWLTYDGLTLNEMLKHDLSEIEYFCGDIWARTINNSEIMSCLDYSNSPINYIKQYRLKPKDEGFVDVEIDWDQFGLLHPCDKWLAWIDVQNIGINYGGWVLSGYVMEDGYHTDKPVKFQENGTVINEKATHARFVKVGE